MVARSVGKTHGPSVRGVSRVSALTQPQWMTIHNKQKTKDDQDKGHCHIYVYPDVTSAGKYSNVHHLCCRWWRVAKWVFYAHLGPLIFHLIVTAPICALAAEFNGIFDNTANCVDPKTKRKCMPLAQWDYFSGLLQPIGIRDSRT